ncbi:MAG: HlyD family efflux transporter periplasmic adaptor subunit [Acidobacteria bacterium]|nr:HlyD family efflux transporter periplasmic adaptor subunit [Acidobacteriota bacterium]
MHYARSPLALPVPPRPVPPAPVALEESPRHRGRGWLLLAMLLAGASLAAWLAWKHTGRAPVPQAPVRTARARFGTLDRTLRAAGITAASRSSYLVAPKLRGTRSHREPGEMSLTLQHLAPSGAPLKKGKVVAEFDRQFMLLRVDDYRSAVIQNEALLLRLRSSLDLRRVQHQQQVRRASGVMEKAALDLKTAPVRSAIQVERYKMNLEEAQARYQQILKQIPLVDASEDAILRRYEIELLQSQMEMRKAENNAQEMVQRAPFDGVLVLRRVLHGTEYTELREGDVLGSGQPFGEIVDPSSIVVDAILNQADVEQVRYGFRARVHFDAYPEIELPARVVSISAVMRAAGQRPLHVRQMPIRLELEESDQRLAPNLSANADIILESEDDVVIMPRECVFRGLDQKPFALVQTDSGWERRKLELGLANDIEVAVESGVKEGDLVAADPVQSASASSPKSSIQ